MQQAQRPRDAGRGDRQRADPLAVGAEPEHTLMVGDTPSDAAAVLAGCRAYVLPAAPPGAENGLSTALALVR